MEELDSRHVGIQAESRRDKGARCLAFQLGVRGYPLTWGLSVPGSFWGGVSRMPRKKVEVIL